MYTEAQLREYLEEIRTQVCSRCVERPPGGPPCLPMGKFCGIELHLPEYLDAIHQIDSGVIEPYLDNMRSQVCSHCDQKECSICPCPMDYLSVLLVQSIETVDQRRSESLPAATSSCT
jgi:hypothetical protein